MMIFDYSNLTHDYWLDRFVRYNLIISLILNVFLFIGLGIASKQLSDLVTLHYNIYFGIDLIGPWYQVFFIPGIGLLFLIINTLIGALIYQQEKILSHFLVSTSTYINFLLILAAVAVIFINF